MQVTKLFSIDDPNLVHKDYFYNQIFEDGKLSMVTIDAYEKGAHEGILKDEIKPVIRALERMHQGPLTVQLDVYGGEVSYIVGGFAHYAKLHTWVPIELGSNLEEIIQDVNASNIHETILKQMQPDSSDITVKAYEAGLDQYRQGQKDLFLSGALTGLGIAFAGMAAAYLVMKLAGQISKYMHRSKN